MTLAEFRRVYPTAAFTVSSGKLFTYRYYQNPQAKATLVLLTGGIGLSDLFYKHFARFARDFSVLTFDYQLQFGDNGEFADAVAELLRHLKEKVWLVGQSLGGVVAQVIASRHPEVVEGLVLSNTCSLSGNMSKAGYQDLMKIIESQRKFKKWLAFLPFPLIKRMMRWAVMKKKTDGFTAQEKAAMEELCGAMMELLTKPYEQHMIDFLCDAEHYFGMTRNDFAPWEGRVLLILSERHHLHPGLPGGPDRPDAKSHGGHRPDRRPPGADGAAGTVCGSGNKIYSGADTMRRAGWSMPAGSLSLSISISHDQAVDGEGHIPCRHQQAPHQDEAADDAADHEVQNKQGGAAAQGVAARHDPHAHPMDAEGQAAEYPEPEKIQLSIPDAGGFENAVQQPGDGDGQNCLLEKFLNGLGSRHWRHLHSCLPLYR